MPVIELDEECRACGGTGLYAGLAERAGIAVVCSTCEGTGCFHFCHKYEPFVARKLRKNIKHVLQINPGIIVGDSRLEDLGGLPYESCWERWDEECLAASRKKYLKEA